MRLEIWIIGVMIFLVAGVLGLIAVSPDNVSVPKSTHSIEISESISIKEPTTTIPMPVPEEDMQENVEETLSVKLEEKIAVEEVEEKTMPSTVEVNVSEGSGVPGCDEANECYVPYEVSIAVGGKVIWNNVDSAAHTVTSGNPTDGPNGVFDSSLFMSGTTFSHVFDESGTYEYFCMVHPWMKGTVQVS